MLMVKKALIYVTGLLFMAFGVAFSVNSSLGVSPVNSLPYVISRITGLDLGNTLQLVFAVLLLILGVLVAIQGVKKLLEKTDDKKATA